MWEFGVDMSNKSPQSAFMIFTSRCLIVYKAPRNDSKSFGMSVQKDRPAEYLNQ